MPFQLDMGSHIEQPVQQTGVPYVDLGGLDLAFTEIGAAGLHHPHHERRFQRIEVTAHRMVRDAERPGQLGAVPDLGVLLLSSRSKAFRCAFR